ncbi:MAG: hypothetical protein ACRYFX_07010 [Janthinobacterium lividum]
MGSAAISTVRPLGKPGAFRLPLGYGSRIVPDHQLGDVLSQF